MFIHLAIHRPKPDKAALLIDSMHRFGAAMTGQPGLQQAHALRDQKTGALIGMAIWDTMESMLAARPAMIAAVKDDPFEEWEDAPPDVFHLETV